MNGKRYECMLERFCSLRFWKRDCFYCDVGVPNLLWDCKKIILDSDFDIDNYDIFSQDEIEVGFYISV